ncbi:Large proline-rich protein bag6 [Ranunculus cassubicifolius]
MYPMYYVDHSYPQSHCGNYYHPNWFSGCNSGYPNPGDCHGCCNHTYPAAYNVIRPPYSCIPPPQPSPLYYHHGPYPPYPAVYPAYAGAYPPPYHVPPNISMEQPRYELNKGVRGRHCCGFSNQGVGMKDEENKREVAKESDSLAPGKSKNENPFSFLWGVPPEYLQHKDGTEGGKGCNSLEKIREEEGNRNQGKEMQFPFPMYWIPDIQRGKDAKISEEQPAMLKVIPVNPLPRSDDRVAAPEVTNDKDKNSHEKGGKESNQTGGKPKEIHVKDNEKELANKSPRKGSKLPPVCLRVDPLPRRKGCKETPSPPSGIKPVENKADVNSAEESKADQGELDHSMEEVAAPPSPQPPSPLDEATGKKTPVAEERAKKKELSMTEAALVIQSFYRGFDVRKWQPLKKLKQIAKVREEVNEVSKRILDLEASSPKDDKQKALVAETIMNLLLQLDTIQGLHPSVREIRKRVAKELVSMQERLDSIISWSSGVEEKPANEPNEHLLPNDEEFIEIGSKSDSLPELIERVEEAKHDEQHQAEDLIEFSTKIESPIEPANGFGEAEREYEGKESSLVETAQSIETEDGSLLEPAKQVEEAGHAEPLQPETMHRSMESDSRTELTAEPEKLEQLQEEQTLSAAGPGEIESKNHSLFNLEDESGVHAIENHGIVRETPENGHGDEQSFGAFENAQHFSGVPECKLEEPTESIAMVNVRVDSEMQGATESFNKDEPAVQESGSVLPACVIDDMPLLHTAEAVDPLLVQDEPGVEEQNDVQELSTLPIEGLEDEPAAEGIESKLPVCTIDELEESVSQETGDGNGPVYSEEHQSVYPVTVENGMENVYETDVHCCNEIDTSSKMTDVIESVGPDIMGFCAENLQETETVKCDKGGEPMKLMEENVELKDLLGKLIKEGKEQMTLISDLNGRIKSLEKKLAKKQKKKNLTMPRRRPTRQLLP